MKKILVDTSVIIDFLRRQDKTNSVFWQVFSQAKCQPVIGLTTVVELWAGKSMSEKKTRSFIEELLDKCEILFPDLRLAKKTGALLRRSNYQLSFQDAHIAVFSLEEHLPLLTLNRKDFARIKGIKFYEFGDQLFQNKKE